MTHVEDIRIKLVDGMDQTLGTFMRPADPRNVDAIALGLLMRWNERRAVYADTGVAVGYYAWNDRGEMLSYS